MKKGFSLIVGMALFLGVATGYADENRVQSVFQEAQQASCADVDKAVRRPMCLSEMDMLTLLVASGGDEELAAASLSGEGRLRVKPTRYGTVRRISGPSLSAEKFSKDGDPVEFVRQYFTRNAAAFGIENPHESLLMPKVFDLKYGGKVVKFKQYYGSVPVYQGQVVAYIGKEGDLLMTHASVIPDENIRLALGDQKTAGEASSALRCEEAETFASAGGAVEVMVLDSADIQAEGGIRLAHRAVGLGADGEVIERLYASVSGDLLKEKELSSNLHRYKVSKRDSPQGASQTIKSTFWCDSCDNAWPDQETEDLWDIIHDIHDVADQDHSFDEWASCNCYPYSNNYDYGMHAKGLNYTYLSLGTHYPCGPAEGASSYFDIAYTAICRDIAGHELTHALQVIFNAFGNSNAFSHCQSENTADIIGELFEDSPDWALGTGTSHYQLRPMGSYVKNSYKWWNLDRYLNYGEHENHGALETAAWMLGYPGTKTKYGISVSSIGVADTAELFWDVLVASAVDQNYEETAGLARTVAADIWGGNSTEYQEVCDAMDAVGIWREPSYVYYDDNGLNFPISRFAPATVDWTRRFGIFYAYEHWLAYTDYESSPSTPADICWVRGFNSNWSSGGCLGLSSSYKTILPVDATVFDDKIWIYFKPANSTLMRYVTIDKSLNLSGVSSSGTYVSSYPRVTTDGSGRIVSIITTGGAPYLVYSTPSSTKLIYVPVSVYSGKTPTPVYNEGDGSIFILYTGTDGKAYVKKGDWSCLINSGANYCWETSGPVPNGSGTHYDETATGSPSGEIWGGELYVSQTIDGPWVGKDTIYTDSCRKPTSNPFIPGNYACNAGLDCGAIDPLCTSHWNQSVPRDISSVDPGELKEYLNRLWLYSSDGFFLHQTWKNSYGIQ